MSAKRIAFGLAFGVACLTAAGTWAQGLPSAAPESVGMSAQRLARIGDAFRKEIDQGKLPGAVFLVARKGKLVTRKPSAFRTKAPASQWRKVRSSASIR